MPSRVLVLHGDQTSFKSLHDGRMVRGSSTLSYRDGSGVTTSIAG